MENQNIINENIHIDQAGYRIDDKKIVVINGKCRSFSIIDGKSGRGVFSGEAVGGIFDAISGDTLYYCDFSSVKNPGTYYVSIPGFGRSYSFKIEDHVYKSAKNTMLKVLYFQRCGIELKEEYAGLWKHPVCHLRGGHIYGREKENIKIDAAGGWHDAGDYGKYTVPGAYAAAYLLLAYKFFPEAFQEEINIPESGNGVPDILNETRFELEWLLKMQDKASGGVYHKLTSKVFPDELGQGKKSAMPEEDTSDLFFFSISSTATADFAAVMALASGIFKPFDDKFSAECLQAAERAWTWLSNNKEIVKFYNPPDVNTGRYGDTNDRDERYWAAAELYSATGKEKYHEYFISSFEKDSIEAGFMWRDVGGLGNIAYLFTDPDKVNELVYKEIKDGFLNMADILANESINNGYLISLSEDAYIWGSSSVLMNAAFYMIIAHIITNGNAYTQAAQNHLHYLLGSNALNQCYVTGIGSKPVMNPHHRPSFADGVEAPVPGLVSGGPNKSLQDQYAFSHLQGNPPARCFIDDTSSFSTNEITVYWNTTAVFVSGYYDK